jgi:hypothetical protein
MLFFNFALKSLSQMKFQQKNLRKTRKNAEFLAISVNNSGVTAGFQGVVVGYARTILWDP